MMMTWCLQWWHHDDDDIDDDIDDDNDDDDGDDIDDDTQILCILRNYSKSCDFTQLFLPQFIAWTINDIC